MTPYSEGEQMRQSIPDFLTRYAEGVKGISLQDRVSVLEEAMRDVLARLFDLEEGVAPPAGKSRKQRSLEGTRG